MQADWWWLVAITGAQIKQVLTSVSTGTGTVASFDVLAAGANDALKRIGVKTVAGAAAFLATMTQESAYFRTTTEYGSGQSYAPYIGRTFEQVTGRDNYAAFGAWAKAKGLISDQNLFVKNPARLGDISYAWLGGVWFWSVTHSSWGARTTVLAHAEAGDFLAVSRAVNLGNPYSASTPNGWSSRQQLYDAFRALGSSILPATTTASPTTAPVGTVPGTPGQIVAAANALWQKYKGKYYGSAWPGLSELGRSPEAWCADFVRLAYRKGTGYDWAKFCSLPAYCPALVKWMVADPLWREVSYGAARPADVVAFFRNATDARNGQAYHFALVEFPETAALHDLQTIEGNTSTPGISASMSNGGSLAKKTRSNSFYTMRIFRPTYFQPVVATDPTTPIDTPVDDPTTDPPVDVRPVVSVMDSAATKVANNPISELRVTPAFLASVAESNGFTVSASLMRGGQSLPGYDNIPILASASSIDVDATSAVRRTGHLTVIPDGSRMDQMDIANVIQQPGIRVSVKAGFSWAGSTETVPVHTGLIDKSTVRLLGGGGISFDSPDLFALVAYDNVPSAVCTPDDWTIADLALGFACESIPGSICMDLTDNTEIALGIIADSGPGSRVKLVQQYAAAIAAELFAAPIPGLVVLRPYRTLEDAPDWSVQTGVHLSEASKTVDWSGVFNRITVTSQRADSAEVRGEYIITDPDHPLVWGGPYGRRVCFLDTSLLETREQCEAAGRATLMRLAGGAIQVDWEQLRNPLMEGGDRVHVQTPAESFDVILEKFTIPLGSQAVAPATARSLSIPGVSS